MFGCFTEDVRKCSILQLSTLSGEVEVMGGAQSGTYFAKLDGNEVVCFASKDDATPALRIALGGKEVKCADKAVQVTSGTTGPLADGTVEILFFASPEQAVLWTKHMSEAARPDVQPAPIKGGRLGKMRGAVHTVNANARLSQGGAAGGAKRTGAECHC